METCVLLPQQLAVVLVFHPDPCHIFEMRATLWTNTALPAGTMLHPHQGRFTLDHLNVYNKLNKHDKLLEFGCSDEIMEVEDREVRHCNWVRFLRVSLDHDKVNIIGSKRDGQPVFRICRDLCANTELVAMLENSDDITTQVIEITKTDDVIIVAEESNIDVIGDSDCDEKKVNSTSYCYDRSLAISPITREYDALSSGSEDVDMVDKSSHYTKVRYNISVENDSGALDLSWSPTSREAPQVQPLVLSSNTLPLPENMIVTSSSVVTPPVRRRERSWLPCDVCGKKFDRPSLLKRHMRTHTGEKPHACDVCGKAFSTSSSLNTHRRIHSGEKPHQCNVCGKRFTASSNLYYHRMTHNKEKPHKCGMCTKSFPTPGDLKSHQYVHSGSWPHKCDVCHRGFSKLTNLNSHRLLHKDEVTSCCSHCNKMFKSNRSINQQSLCEDCRPQRINTTHRDNLKATPLHSTPNPMANRYHNTAAQESQTSSPNVTPLKPLPVHAYDQMLRSRDLMQAYHNFQAHYNSTWNTSTPNY